MGTRREHSRRCGGDRGASVTEYSLLLALVVIICIVTVAMLGSQTMGFLDKAGEGSPGSPATPFESPGGSDPGGSTPTTAPCSTTSTLPGDGGADCTTTTTAEP
jgi:Flp pilus assembly pilin Flp